MQKRIENIDYIKGIAILGVILVHSTQLIPSINSMVFTISKFGKTGCQLFFVMSAFLATLSYTKLNEHFFPFIVKKYTSLAPLYQITIFVYIILNFFVFQIFHLNDIGFQQLTDIGAIIENLLLLNGLFDYGNTNVVPGGWFIGTLIIFCALFPALYRITRFFYTRFKKVFFLIPFAAYLVSAILDTYLIKLLQDVEVFGYRGFFIGGFYNSFVNQMSCFIIGILLYLLYEDDMIPVFSKNFSFISSIVLVLITIYLVFYGNNLPFCLTNSVFTAALFTAFFFIFTFDLPLSSKLSRAVSTLGKNSYGVFYTHFIFVWYVLPLLIRGIQQLTNYACNTTILYFVFMLLLLPLIFWTGMQYQRLSLYLAGKLNMLFLPDK